MNMVNWFLIILILFTASCNFRRRDYNFYWFGTGEQSVYSVLGKEKEKAEAIFLQINRGENPSLDKIKLLQQKDLVRVEDNQPRLNFSIIEGKEYQGIIDYAEKSARLVFSQNKKIIKDFVTALQEEKLKSSPLIWFSIILDDYMWRIFSRENLTYFYPTKEEGVPVGTTGYYWGLEKNSSRKVIGTNALSDGHVSYKFNWSYRLFENYPKLNAFFWNKSDLLLKLYRDKSFQINSEDRRLLHQYNLIDSNNSPRITIWRKNSKIDKMANKISIYLGQSFVSFWKEKNINMVFQNKNNYHYNFCIFYHEAMYSFLEVLLKENLLIYNKALADSVDIEKHLIDDLLLIVLEK